MNKLIIDKVSENIPSNVKLVDYLMDILNLSRESIYRRVRGDLPFTFDQVMTLSSELKFSLDSIGSRDNSDSSCFRMRTPNEISPEEKYKIMLTNCDKLLERQLKAKDMGAIVTMNRIFDLFSVAFDKLSHFFYYRWLHQAKDLPFNYNLSNLILPDDVKELQKKIAMNHHKVDNTTFFVDSDSLKNTILEIRYYYDRGHINDEELSLLKADMAQMIDLSEITARKGYHDSDHKFDYYISEIPIPVNSILIWYDDNTELFIWPYTINPLFNKNSDEVKNIHLEWIASMKKRSASISQSNEALQERHYRQQREYLNSIL